MKAGLRTLLSLLPIAWALSLAGCSREVDLYGESRQVPPSGQEPALLAGSRVVPAGEAVALSGGEGIFKIIPPAVINPKNVADTDPRLLTIDFQAGFNGEVVEVWRDGERVFGERLLSNRAGYADTVSLEFADPTEGVRFTLRFPDRGLRETFTVDPDKGRFLGIAIRGGRLAMELQEGPFFYD